MSTGKAEQVRLQRALYSASSDAEVGEKYDEALARLREARLVVLGVPSDVGAGYRRGANLGPSALRTRLLQVRPDFPERARALGIVDAGDVFVVPQLLEDDMLSDAQKARTARALYPDLDDRDRAKLPVSPLSIEEAALDAIFRVNPRVAPVVLGGDHSTAWPVVSSLSRLRPPANDRWAIVQIDAHTDLLEERLGIRHCFATWSWHAAKLLGEGRMVQLGVRASGRDRAHWESTTGVRQFWADQCLREPEAVIDHVIDHLKSRGLGPVYFSNDVDGTDAAFADATGTPEPDGLTPDFVNELLRRLAKDVGVLGGDVMEVAPPLKDDPEKTLDLGVDYFLRTIEACLGEKV